MHSAYTSAALATASRLAWPVVLREGDRSKSEHFRRNGVTLLELLITMALLVGLGMLVWAQLQKPLDTIKLEKAADLVCAALAKARVGAMTSGETHAFKYEPGADRFCVERWQGPDSAIDAAEGAGLDQETAVAASTVTTEKSLPEGVAFLEAQVEADTRNSTGMATIDSATEETPTSVILLYPDGSTSTASILLGLNESLRVVVKLRGITGIARAGEVYSAESAVGQ